MKKWLSVFMVVSMLVAAPLFAKMKSGSPCGSGKCCMKRMGQASGKHEDWKSHNFSELGLSDDQKKKMQEIKGQLEQNLMALKIEQKKKKLELAQLFLQSNPDRTAVEQKLQEMNGLRNKKSGQLVEAHFQVLAMLTPEQQRKFSKYIVQMILDEDKEGGEGQERPHMMKMRSNNMPSKMPAKTGY